MRSKKGIFRISSEEEASLTSRILSKFRTVNRGTGSGPFTSTSVTTFQKMKNRVEAWRLEIETFLNTRDLERDLSYKEILSAYPTSIRTFLNEVIQDIIKIIKDLTRTRFYILLDECDLLSRGQQKVINTIIKPRFTTMVFKLASRPPDIRTMETIEEGVGLTDREVKRIYLDEMYNPTSKSYRDLCFRVAKKRLEKYGYAVTDIRKILGKFKVEEEIGRSKIESYLKTEYPNKNRVKNKFSEVYKDFKVAASFQILGKKRLGKKYAGFDTFVMLSSGIMLHFLESCRDTFSFSWRKYITHDETGRTLFKQLPIPAKIQNKAAQKVSKDFYRNIEGRAESLKDTSIDMEFGAKIQYIVSTLGGIFREKLTTFNEPEAARIEIPEGKSSLDDSLENPIRQIFETAIAISVFQEGKPYMPKRYGGIRPPTYILNRILTPYLRISPRPRWRTKIPTEVFNRILNVRFSEFRNEVFGMRKKEEKPRKEEPLPKSQVTLPFFQVSEDMPVLLYLSKKVKTKLFKGKTLLVLLHFLKDLIPFLNSCRKAGASPSDTILFYKNYQYLNKDEIANILSKEGYRIYPMTKVDEVLKQLNSEQTKEMIVIEDGGHIVPKLHKDFKSLAKVTLGAVEQTTKGIRNDAQIKKLRFPVISIPGSDLKDTFEPHHVARAVVNNIQNLLPDINFSGRKALTIGFGHVGKKIALQLRDTLKMQVSIHDLDSNKLVEAQQCGFGTEENLAACLERKLLVVGATGETTVRRSEILAMEHNVYLVSASSEQWEFCVPELEALCSEKVDLFINGRKIGTRYKIRKTEKYVNLIADGYPINFWKMESMPNEVSDLIMSLMFVSALEIAKNRHLRAKINYDTVNKLAGQYELSKIYLEYHK